MNNEQLLRRFIELKAKESEVKEELESIKDDVISVISSISPENRVKFEGFMISIGSRDSYSYPEEILSIERKYKELKKKYEKNAEPEKTSFYPICRQIKNDEPE